MHSRILAVLVPTLALFGSILGVLLANESAQRSTAQAYVDEQVSASILAEQLGGFEVASPEAAAEVLPAEAVLVGIDGARLFGDTVVNVSVALPQLDGVGSTPARTLPTSWPWTTKPIVVRQRVVSGPFAGATLFLTNDGEALRRSILKSWVMLGAAILTGLALVAAASYPLSKWALRPVRSLGETAEAIRQGDLTARAHVGPGAPEMRRLGRSFNEMAAAVSGSLEREREFVADASHHLGNLLTPLRLRIESMDVSGVDESVQASLAEIDRLDSVVERLLELARAEDPDVVPAPVAVGPAIEECLHSWEPLASVSGMSIERTGRDSATAWLVPGALQEALDHLLDNAMKYSRGKRVTVAVLQGITNVRVVVADDGEGMTHEELDAAAGRFWRGATQQNQQGSGLGLAVVASLVGASGGRVALRSGVDGGLEVHLVLKTSEEPAPVAGFG